MNKQKTPEIYSLTVLEMISPNTSLPLPFPAFSGPGHASACGCIFPVSAFVFTQLYVYVQ